MVGDNMGDATVKTKGCRCGKQRFEEEAADTLTLKTWVDVDRVFDSGVVTSTGTKWRDGGVSNGMVIVNRDEGRVDAQVKL